MTDSADPISGTISEVIGDLGGIAGRLPAVISPEQREVAASVLEKLAAEIHEAAVMLRNAGDTSPPDDG